jgi:GntR family transcriptional regulator
MEQVKRRVAVGDWQPGQPIPSIRQLAADLQVSVITVKRAYLELEREGIIVTQHGKGSMVAPGADVGNRIREEDLLTHLEQAVHAAEALGLSGEELQARLREVAARLMKEATR